MKKYAVLFVFLLASCAKTSMLPYTGNETVVGNGGFLQTIVTAEELWLQDDFPNQAVSFYRSGLPTGETCTLLAYISSQSQRMMAADILKIGGNVATQSTVTFPLKFKNDAGVLDSTGNAGAFQIGNGVKWTTYHGYNIFFCAK